jgi:hypothetical protein
VAHDGDRGDSLSEGRAEGVANRLGPHGESVDEIPELFDGDGRSLAWLTPGGVLDRLVGLAAHTQVGGHRLAAVPGSGPLEADVEDVENTVEAGAHG